MGGMSDSDFVEGHQLDAKTIRKVPKDVIGKPRSTRQAKQLLNRIATR